MGRVSPVEKKVYVVSWTRRRPRTQIWRSLLGSFRFEDEDEALCFRHNEIFKLFRLQLGWDDESWLQQLCHAITVTDLSMRTIRKTRTWSSFSSSSSNLKLSRYWDPNWDEVSNALAASFRLWALGSRGDRRMPLTHAPYRINKPDNFVDEGWRSRRFVGRKEVISNSYCERKKLRLTVSTISIPGVQKRARKVTRGTELMNSYYLSLTVETNIWSRWRIYETNSLFFIEKPARGVKCRDSLSKMDLNRKLVSFPKLFNVQGNDRCPADDTPERPLR